MRNVIENANLLDRRGGDFKINSTFETASGTTNVEIQKSKSSSLNMILLAGSIVAVLIALIFIFKG